MRLRQQEQYEDWRRQLRGIVASWRELEAEPSARFVENQNRGWSGFKRVGYSAWVQDAVINGTPVKLVWGRFGTGEGGDPLATIVDVVPATTPDTAAPEQYFNYVEGAFKVAFITAAVETANLALAARALTRLGELKTPGPRTLFGQPRGVTIENVSRIPEAYLNREYVIDMTLGPAGRTNAAGFPRNGPWFWRQMLNKHPELFSAANAAKIRRDLSPEVDSIWIKANPTHQSFLGDKLLHHHIDQGAIATGLPERLHRAWFIELHPNL